MSTHNPCCGTRIRKTGIPFYTPVFLYKKWGLRGYVLQGHVARLVCSDGQF